MRNTKTNITLLIGSPATGKNNYIQRYISENPGETVLTTCFDNAILEISKKRGICKKDLFILPSEEEIMRYTSTPHPTFGKIIEIESESIEKCYVFEEITEANKDIVNLFMSEISLLHKKAQHIFVDLPLLSLKGEGGREHIVEVITGAEKVSGVKNKNKYISENFNINIIEFRNTNTIRFLSSHKKDREDLIDSLNEQNLNSNQKNIILKEVSKIDKKLFNAFLPNVAVSVIRAFKAYKKKSFNSIPPESFFTMFYKYDDPKDSSGIPGTCELFTVLNYIELPLTQDTFFQRIEDKLRDMSTEYVFELKDFINSSMSDKYNSSIISIIDSMLKKIEHPSCGLYSKEDLKINKKEYKKMDIFCTPTLSMIH